MIRVGWSRPNHWNPLSSLIMLWQGGTKYSHAYIRFLEPTTGIEMVAQASYGLVHLVPWEKFKMHNIVFAEKKAKNQSIEKIMSFVMPRLGTKYGVKTLFGIAFGIKGLGNDDEKTFICSEFVAAAENFEGDLDMVTPKKLFLMYGVGYEIVQDWGNNSP